jgi:hypothetical protein
MFDTPMYRQAYRTLKQVATGLLSFQGKDPETFNDLVKAEMKKANVLETHQNWVLYAAQVTDSLYYDVIDSEVLATLVKEERSVYM